VQWWEGGGGAVIAALITVWWAPWSEKRKEQRRDKAIMKLWMKGEEAIPGLRAAIVAGPERVQELENAYKDTADILKRHDGLFVTYGDTLEKVQKGITNLTREFVEWQKENRRNGGGGPGFGDSLTRIETALGTSEEKTNGNA
jgi:hypothetical protein